MRPEPGRQLVDVACDLESRHVRRRRRSRSGKRGRVTPRHEEREPRPLESVLETGHPPLDALPGRARSGSSADGQAESGRRGVDVVGPYRPADQVALARVEDSAAEVVASRDVLVDDCDQLEIGVAERDDPVGRAGIRCQPRAQDQCSGIRALPAPHSPCNAGGLGGRPLAGCLCRAPRRYLAISNRCRHCRGRSSCRLFRGDVPGVAGSPRSTHRRDAAEQ